MENTKRNKALVIAEGKLITVNKPPTKQLYEKGLSDFWFDSTKNILYYYQEVDQQKKEKSIQLSFHEGKYQYEGITSNNLYEVIVRSSLFSTLFGHGEQHVAVTEESMKLPYEEQPWFIGGVDGAELKEIEHAQTRMFFTRSRGPKVYLHWTTTKRVNKHERPILLESNDLSSVLPRGAFITARYNGGQNHQMHRNEMLFCRKIIENDMVGAKKVFAQGVDLACPELLTPNIITLYIQHETIDQDFLLWLLKIGVAVDHSDTQLIENIAQKCNDVVVEALLDRGAFISPSKVREAVSRRLPAHRIRYYFKSYSESCYDLPDYMYGVENYGGSNGFENKILVTLAWEFGNDDNLFKLLPRELITQITSYDIEDPYPWLAYVKNFKLKGLKDKYYLGGQSWEFERLCALALIGWQYWHAIKDPADHDFIIDRVLNNNPDTFENDETPFYDNLSKSNMEELISLVIKLSTCKEIEKLVMLNSHLFYFLIHHENSAPHFKSLLDANVLKSEWLAERVALWKHKRAIPLAAYVGGKNANHGLKQLLISEKLLE